MQDIKRPKQIIPNQKLQTQRAQKLKVPICGQKKQNIARICTDKNCSSSQNNQLMCGVADSSCNTKSHKKCYQFINYDCVNSIIVTAKEKAMTDVFEKVLKTLIGIANTAVNLFNQMLENQETYMIPQPIREIKRILNKDGVLRKQSAAKLKKFYDQFPKFQIPNLKEFQPYNQSTKKIAEICTNFHQSFGEFAKNLNKTLVEHQKLSVMIMDEANTKKKIKSNQQSQNQRGQRSSSFKKV